MTVRHTGWADVLPPGRGAITVRCEATGSVPTVAAVRGARHRATAWSGNPHGAVADCWRSRSRGLNRPGVSGTVCAEDAGTRPFVGPQFRSEARAGQNEPETGPRRDSCSGGHWTVHPHPQVRPTFASTQGGTRLRKTDGPPRPRSAERRFKGTGSSRLAKRTVLRENPLMRSLSGAWVLHHHSPHRAA